jgi:hypothetical protein
VPTPSLILLLWRDLENGAVGTASAKGCPKQVFAAIEGDPSIGKESVVRRAGKAVQYLPLAVAECQLENPAPAVDATLDEVAIQVSSRNQDHSAHRVKSVASEVVQHLLSPIAARTESELEDMPQP